MNWPLFVALIGEFQGRKGGLEVGFQAVLSLLPWTALGQRPCVTLVYRAKFHQPTPTPNLQPRPRLLARFPHNGRCHVGGLSRIGIRGYGRVQLGAQWQPQKSDSRRRPLFTRRTTVCRIMFASLMGYRTSRSHHEDCISSPFCLPAASSPLPLSDSI